MAGVRLMALGIVLLATVQSFAATRLTITSRPSRDKARLAYSSTDALAGLDKGAATDIGAISATIWVRHDGATTRFVVPAGAYDGRAGWLVNDAARALYANRDAPDGPTDTMRTTFATGRRVKLVAKGLGDVSPLAFSGVPGTEVELSYVVTNGAETKTHCTKFAATSCRYAPLDGGSGWKLRCDSGVADLECGAAPVCGNGVRESGEQCDGGVGCTANCYQGIFSCCQGENHCVAAFPFSLQYYLLQYCQASLYGSQPYPGAMCLPDGTCGDAAIETVPICCQSDPTTCQQQSASSVSGVWYVQYYCLGGTGIGGGRYIVINATCGGDGVCVPN